MALSPERQSARMSEIKNSRLDLDGAEHLTCNYMMAHGLQRVKFKDLSCAAHGVYGSYHQISAQFELFAPNLYLVV